MAMFDEMRNIPSLELDDRSGAILWIAVVFLLAVGFVLGWLCT